MPSSLTPQQIAFDTAVKAWSNFDYRGIADLEELRNSDPARGSQIDQLIEIRESFNASLAVEGQNIIGDAPHAPFYLDYLDSEVSNALAFKDEHHSFIGVTIPLVIDVSNLTQQIADSDAVVSLIGLPPVTDRDMVKGVLFWMLLGFVVSHEYAHHTHGHLAEMESRRPGSNRLWQQAFEADADGWASYLTLNQWVLAAGRPVTMKFLNLEDAPPSVQDIAGFACFFVSQAAFTFLRVPRPIDKNKVYWEKHPPQPVRLKLMSRFVVKFIDEFRPDVRQTITEPWYNSLMDAVSALRWTTGKHAALWREHHQFLRHQTALHIPRPCSRNSTSFEPRSASGRQKPAPHSHRTPDDVTCVASTRAFVHWQSV